MLVENDVGFRCRGTRGSAWVTVRNCTLYKTARAFRFEDKVRNMKVFQMAYGEGVKTRFQGVAGGRGRGAATEGERRAPPLARWPYVRLPVGAVATHEKHAVFSDKAIPTKIATGWQPPGYDAARHRRPRTDGSGRSLAQELFGRHRRGTPQGHR